MKYKYFTYNIECIIDNTRHVLQRWGMTPDEAKKILLKDYKHTTIQITLITLAELEPETTW